MSFKASYLKLSEKKLEDRAKKAWEFLSPCRVCPRNCKVDRALRSAQGKLGFCRIGRKSIVSSYNPHFGEERPLVGVSGSGTIFFASCNLACVYCQNWEISQLRQGREVESKEIAEMMISLQNLGCHNINFVSPTINVPQILKALPLAIKQGLEVPLVYNTGGYDAVPTLKLLDGIFDIYMPDIKYSDSKIAKKYSLVPNYWEVVQKAVREIHRQVGDLMIDKKGIAERGLLIRHLVLPEGIAGTKKIMKFIASLSKDSYVNIMAQYRPEHKASLYPEIDRRITPEEFQEAMDLAKRVGLWRFD